MGIQMHTEKQNCGLSTQVSGASRHQGQDVSTSVKAPTAPPITMRIIRVVKMANIFA